MARFRAVLFDLFDTLLYMRPTSAWEEGIRLVNEAGLSKEQWLGGWDSTGDRAMRGEIRTMRDRVRLALTAAGLSAPGDDLVDAITEARERDARESACLYDDAIPGLTHLRRLGYRVGLVGNIFMYERQFIDWLGLSPLLDCAIVSAELGFRKPDARIYLAAAEALAVEPKECVFIGDGMCDELSGAKAVGMTAVRIDREVRWEGAERDPIFDARVKDLAEFVSWLRKDESGGNED